ncbi:MAG: DUF1349 domain-containing protein [Aggregatilineales bacterium]
MSLNWYNEPAVWSEKDGALMVTAGAKTDFWRVTLHDFIKDDAHFYYQDVAGDFTVTVKITGQYATLYDQAGLMVRESETVWMKCGIEYLDGVQQASAVITRDFSDWSIVPLDDNPETIWIRTQRTGSAIEVYYSRNGENFVLIRQGYLTATDTLQVGVMCAAPQGDGFEVIFEDFQIMTG